jgi:hypothetical protein
VNIYYIQNRINCPFSFAGWTHSKRKEGENTDSIGVGVSLSKEPPGSVSSSRQLWRDHFFHDGIKAGAWLMMAAQREAVESSLSLGSPTSFVA